MGSTSPQCVPNTSLPLITDTAYEWKVRLWSGSAQPSLFSQPAAFTTGLLAQSDWGGAQWIGGGKYLRKDFTVSAAVAAAGEYM
jgi:hypothetical protein